MGSGVSALDESHGNQITILMELNMILCKFPAVAPARSRRQKEARTSRFDISCTRQTGGAGVARRTKTLVAHLGDALGGANLVAVAIANGHLGEVAGESQHRNVEAYGNLSTHVVEGGAVSGR